MAKIKYAAHSLAGKRTALMLLLAGQAHWGGGWWRCGHWREWSHDGYSSRFEGTPLLPVPKREAHAFISPRQDYCNAPWVYLSAATHFSNCFKTVCFPSQIFRCGHIAPFPLVHLLMFVSDVFWLIWSGVEPYMNTSGLLKSPSQLFALTELTSQRFYQLRQLKDVFISLFTHSSTATLLPW